MFGGAFFGARYFGPRYWGKIGGTPVIVKSIDDWFMASRRRRGRKR